MDLKICSMIHPTANLYGRNNIGEGTTIGAFCDIGGVEIGDDCKIQCQVSIPRGWQIGNKVFIGPAVHFANDKHPNLDDNFFDAMNGCVGDGVVIGMGALIGPGVTLGKGCVIGMGAVVIKDVEPYTTVVGNPAKPI